MGRKRIHPIKHKQDKEWPTELYILTPADIKQDKSDVSGSKYLLDWLDEMFDKYHLARIEFEKKLAEKSGIARTHFLVTWEDSASKEDICKIYNETIKEFGYAE